MADNSTLNPGAGGDTIRDKDRGGVKTQIVGLDINPAGSEVLGTGDATNGLDVDVTRVQGTVAVAGTVTANLAAGTNNIGDVDVLTAPGTVADNGALPAVVGVVGGYDGTNVQVIKTDVNGIVQTAQNGTVAVTDNGGSLTVDGTVTANAGAGPWPVTDNGGSLTVDGTVGISGSVAVTDNASSLTVDAPVGTPVFVRLSDGSSAIATLPVSLASLPALAAGTNTIGIVGLAPQTAGGLSISRAVSAASTNATSAKASAGQVFGWFVSNTNAAARYLKLYNKASAPTVGTDTPVMTILIPGNTAGAGATVEFTNGVAFGTGIAWALTTGAADSDTGAVAASEIIVNLLYK